MFLMYQFNQILTMLSLLKPALAWKYVHTELNLATWLRMVKSTGLHIAIAIFEFQNYVSYH